MKRSLATVGIDLGTTHSSVVAFDSHQAPHLLPISSPNHTVPTSVFFPENSAPSNIELWDQESQFSPCLIGKEAHSRLLSAPGQGAVLFKRRMGEKEWYLEIGRNRYSAESLSAHFLFELRKRCAPYLPEDLEGAVVAVPAYFPDAARRSTYSAAEKAGWPLLGLLNEPTAAALAYGYRYRAPGVAPSIHRSSSDDPQGEPILVFDLGGGTLDLSVLWATPHQLQVIASLGDPALGCQDWDDAVAQSVADSFVQEFQWNPIDYPESYEKLRRICKHTRERLSNQQEVMLQFHEQGCQFAQSWSHSQLVRETQPLLQRCRELLDQILTESNLQASQFKRVLLAGGGCRMPMVVDMLHEYFGLLPDRSLDPASAVATGAALFAMQLIQKPVSSRHSDSDLFLAGKTVQEVAPYPLGLLHLEDKQLRYRPLFPKNAPLPAHLTLENLSTSEDNQTSLELLLSQSEEQSFQPDALVAACRIDGIPEMPKGEANLSVTLTYNKRGLVEVQAEESTTQTSLQTTMLSTQNLLEKFQSNLSRHIVIAVDTSASMKGRPLVEAKYAIKRFLEVMQEQQSRHFQKVGLISFGNDGVSLLSRPRRDFTYIRGVVSQLSSGGKTPMTQALSLSLEILSEMALEEEVHERVVVLVSDGLPNQPNQATQIARKLHQENIRVIAIGLGENVDENFLAQEICSRREDYRGVEDPIALPVTLASLAMELRWRS